MLANLPQYIANARKAVINILGLLTSLLALDLLPSKYAGYGAGAVAVLTVIVHYMTPNAPAPGDAVAEDVDYEDEDAVAPDEFQPAPVVTAGQVAAQNEQAAPPPA